MNKLIVITGATKGIGRAIVEKFALEGFDIVASSRNGKDLHNLQNSISQNNTHITLHPWEADLSTKAGTESLTKYVLDLNRDVDILMNNVGLFLPGLIHLEDDGNLQKMIETNLYSGYRLTRGLVGKMIEKRSGHIFNICSTASIEPYTNGGSYTISKHAQYGMSKMLREELKVFNIRVTSVIPGSTYTASWEGVDIPRERFMQPEDIANSIFTAWQLSPGTVVEDIELRPMEGNI